MSASRRGARDRQTTTRPARIGDLDRLLTIERAAFAGDQLDRRAFRHAVRSPSMTILVAEIAGQVAAYALLELRRGSTLARLTSIAVDPEASRRGLGGDLLTAVERDAVAAGCDRLRLEVRADNPAAIALYERRGYARFAEVPDYYEDGGAAVRFEKALASAG